MTKQYNILDTRENKDFMRKGTLALLDFGVKFPSPQGGAYYLGSDGEPMLEKPRETWITSRMAHVYSIGSMMGIAGCKDLAKRAIDGLLNGELKDKINGGWYAGINADGSIIPGKQCYAHAFVILAATSGYLAGIDGAEELLKEALFVYDKYFWDEEAGMAVDSWNTEFTELDEYRGLNANMHTVEAFLAVIDAVGDEKYRERAGRIIDRVAGWAKENNYRLPEHFTKDWEPDYEKNKDKPDDQFKPYGATPGHGIEWARLIVQWALTSREQYVGDAKLYVELSQKLFERAVGDAWNADGQKGICYTTDWKGKPVVRDRMHWTLAEGINTAAVLYRLTGKELYGNLYSDFVQYLNEYVIDYKNGSWFHQLNEQNKLKETVWPGKPDLYHAFQATIIPYNQITVSIAKAVKESRQ